MPRYKDYCYEQDKLIPIAFSKQILPGTFEYTLDYLIDNVIDLSVFEHRYNNDDTGAPEIMWARSQFFAADRGYVKYQ